MLRFFFFFSPSLFNIVLWKNPKANCTFITWKKKYIIKDHILKSKLAYALFFISLGTKLCKCETYSLSKNQFSEKAYAAYICKTLYLHIGTDKNRKIMSLKK